MVPSSRFKLALARALGRFVLRRSSQRGAGETPSSASAASDGLDDMDTVIKWVFSGFQDFAALYLNRETSLNPCCPCAYLVGKGNALLQRTLF